MQGKINKLAVIGFTFVLVAFAITQIPNKYSTNGNAAILLFLFWLLFPIGFMLLLRARKQIQATHQGGKSLTNMGLVIGIYLFTIFVLGGILIGVWMGVSGW